MVEIVGIHQVKWFVMLESAKDRILGVDTPGQHDQSRYMVLQPYPLAFVCLILVVFSLWLGEHVAHRFQLLTSHDQSCYMVLQPYPLAFVCLILVGFSLWLFYVLDLCWWS
jgi:hypothetical protein